MPQSPQTVVPFVRSFPWEITVQIIKEADASTLAALGPVSLDFLQETSHLLLRDVEIRSFEQLALLFCDRDDETVAFNPWPSRINQLLDLSLIQILTIDLTSTLFSSMPSLSSSFKLFTPRIPGLTPLPLDRLRIAVNQKQEQDDPIMRLLHSSLFPFVDPTHWEYTIHQRSLDEQSLYVPFRPYRNDPPPFLHGFSRTRTLTFRGAVFLHVLIPPFSLQMAYLPRPSLEVRRVVQLHLHTLLYGPDFLDVGSFTKKVKKTAILALGLKSMQEGSVVLVVRSKKERREVRKVVEEMEEGWKGKFVVELEG